MTINKSPYANIQQQPVNINFSYYPVNSSAAPQPFAFPISTPGLQTELPLITLTTTSFTIATDTSVSVLENAAGPFLMGGGQGSALSTYNTVTPGSIGYFYLCDVDASAYALIAYTGVSNQDTFTGCQVISSTSENSIYDTNSVLADPRYMYSELLTGSNSPQYIAFDAIDFYNQGLPKSLSANIITQWNWDFGNGKIATGPIAVTYYWSIVPSQQIQVSLEAIDVFGKPHYCTRGLNFTASVNTTLGISTPSVYGVQSS